MRLWAILPLAAPVLLVVAANAAFPSSAVAQDRSAKAPVQRASAANVTTEAKPGDDVSGKKDETRVHDSFQPKGVELGQFLLFPAIEVAQEYNSNVFASKDNVRDDFATRVTGKAALRSRFRQHSLSAGAEIEQYSYWKYVDDNTLSAQAFVDGRYDFSKEWEANGSLLAFKRAEDRGSPDDVAGNKPTPYYGLTSKLGTRLNEGRFTYGLNGQLDRRSYEDVETSTGTSVNNSDRDRWEYELTGRGEYEMFPGYSAVAQVSANRRQYDSEVDDAGFKRSSYGGKAYAGVGVDLSQLLKGDFLVGYLRQNYEDANLSDPSGPALKATFNWSPSRLTLVVPSLERSVLETTTANASSIVSNKASLLVRHEMQRDVVLTGYLSASYDEFEGTDRDDTTYEARVRVLWSLAPEYFVGGEIGYRRRDSTVDTSDFAQTVAIARFGLRM